MASVVPIGERAQSDFIDFMDCTLSLASVASKPSFAGMARIKLSDDGEGRGKEINK